MFERIFVPAQFRDALSGHAWLQAMLDAERALAAAEARAGVIPGDAAEAIAADCRAELFDPAAIADEGRAPGNPVEPLVRALRDAVGGDAAQYVHWGATSQDILDTATMLVSRNALDLILEDLARVAVNCAALAETHRTTPIAGRTLLQQAVPTTFGLKAAGWLVAVLEARRRLKSIRQNGLAVQLGGAAGTLAALGEAGPEVLRLFAEELELHEPVAPWHTNRVGIAELGAALDVAAGVLAKIGLDVGLLSQTEVAEVREAEGGVSSTMPQKRNPIGSVLAVACARQVHAQASVLTAALPQEHERALGAWHSEWPALRSALAYTGGAAAGARRALEGLEVDTDRMRENLDPTVMAEKASFMPAQELDLDPESYLGSAETFVDRALAAYREELE
jgi:3-carboxy-cis,cis-muconate cycloisomerase